MALSDGLEGRLFDKLNMDINVIPDDCLPRLLSAHQDVLDHALGVQRQNY